MIFYWLFQGNFSSVDFICYLCLSFPYCMPIVGICNYLCFVVCYCMSILVLQPLWWGRESWLLCLVCHPGVSWLLCGSSLMCHRFVCSLRLWYFLIILTYYFCGHLLGKGLPLDSLVCDVFLCFCHFPIWCFGSGMELDCIDSWSLPSFLLLQFSSFNVSNMARCAFKMMLRNTNSIRCRVRNISIDNVKIQIIMYILNFSETISLEMDTCKSKKIL